MFFFLHILCVVEVTQAFVVDIPLTRQKTAYLICMYIYINVCVYVCISIFKYMSMSFYTVYFYIAQTHLKGSVSSDAALNRGQVFMFTHTAYLVVKARQLYQKGIENRNRSFILSPL